MRQRSNHLIFSLAILCTACNTIAPTPWGTSQCVAQEIVAGSLVDANVKSALAGYVHAADDSFTWEIRETSKLMGCEVIRLHLTSQTWKGQAWRHVLTLIKPPKLAADRTDALLVVAGGSWKKEWPDNGPDHVAPRGEAQLLAGVASQFGCLIAVISQVPLQPQMGDKYEDEIIAATFAKYLESGDPTWPLLLPMAKSAVRAMDATTAAAKEHWDINVNHFTVTGASKRGWTTWLTSAVDSRVTALAPMVIDMLNMSEQMPHQLASWGKYSEQIADYTRLSLPKYLATPAGKKLQQIVDPYSYREQITAPKLLIFGTNDRYWPVDACNLYWEQLQGDKYLLYVPNQGHDLNDYSRVVGSIRALHLSQNAGLKLPEFTWKFESSQGKISLTIQTESPVQEVVAWVAQSDSRDFRDAPFKSQPLTATTAGQWQVTIDAPATGNAAILGELKFDAAGIPAYLSTNVRVFPAE